jgi:uncharacterized protein (TIGR03792 family)
VYLSGERRPIEVLVFEMDPSVVNEFIAVDHEVWTLGEAKSLEHGDVPFISKEVWVDDAHPGQVTIVFVWESLDAWMAVADPEIQKRLQAEFDERFTHPVRLIAAPHETSNFGIHRVSRYERETLA